VIRGHCRKMWMTIIIAKVWTKVIVATMWYNNVIKDTTDRGGKAELWGSLCERPRGFSMVCRPRRCPSTQSAMPLSGQPGVV
jgi:hypothetical protein